MDVAVENVLCVLEDVSGVVGEDNLDVVAQTLVVLDVVNTCESVLCVIAEYVSEFFLVEAV